MVEAALREHGLEYTPHGNGFVTTLPGVKKLKTTVLFELGDHGLRVEAFVCRKPDEHFAEVYRFLLRRNQRLYGVAYTLDRIGDIYLTGRVADELVTEAEVDRLLGQVLEAADGDFNTILELGFASSIRREYQWRVSRGESLANLAAFEHLTADLAERPPSQDD